MLSELGTFPKAYHLLGMGKVIIKRFQSRNADLGYVLAFKSQLIRSHAQGEPYPRSTLLLSQNQLRFTEVFSSGTNLLQMEAITTI